MSTATHRSLAEPVSTGASWLSRAVSVSVVLHALVAVGWWAATKPAEHTRKTTVDIEVAPPPPPVEALPAEVATPPESAPQTAQANTATLPDEQEPNDLSLHDAGVDAPVDAALDAGVKKRRADAGIDAPSDAGGDAQEVRGISEMERYGDGGLFAGADAGAPEGDDAGAAVAAATTGSGAGSSAGMGTGSEGSGVAAATETGSGSGVAGVDTQPAVDGAPTTAGTAANLLAYFPPGHQVTALVRFDRLRKTEWADPAEALFQPMPDYQLLFGARDANIADKFDTLVISSPRPQDVVATTLVVHSALPRPELRTFLTNARTPIAWSATKGGMYGRRSGRLFPGDKRVLLSPWRDWIVLAHPDDLPGLTAPAKGSLDKIEVKVALPPWLQTIRTIEQESGDEKTRGPALVLTLAGPGTRYEIPDVVGLGITSLPSPQRLTVAMELVPTGWLIRGNIVFTNEADAKEFEASVTAVRQRVLDSRILSGLLKKQHALNLVQNFALARTEARVSYSTSMSIADAHAIMAAAAATLDAYFGGKQQPP